MKKALVAAVVIVLCSSVGFAQEAAQLLSQVDQKTVKLEEVGNTQCPVSHETVGQMGAPIKMVYKGKIYNLCCPMCVKTFKADPEKYSKIAEDQAKAGK